MPTPADYNVRDPYFTRSAKRPRLAASSSRSGSPLAREYNSFQEILAIGLLDGQKLEAVPNVNFLAKKINELAITSSRFGFAQEGSPVNYGVGAAIVMKTDEGTKILVEGVNTTIHDLTIKNKNIKRATDGHAETNAMRVLFSMIRDKVGKDAKVNYDKLGFWQGVELWTSLQPCHLCTGVCTESRMPTFSVAKDDVVTHPDDLYEEHSHLRKRTQEIFTHVGLDPVPKGIFKGQKVDKVHVKNAHDIFQATAQQVRDYKKSLQDKEAVLVNYHDESDAARMIRNHILAALPERYSEDHIIHKHVKAFDAAGKLTDQALELLVDIAIKSHKSGDGKINSALIIDPHGYVVDTVTDRTIGKDPLRTPIMRSMDRTVRVQKNFPDQSLGKINQFQIVSIEEPREMEYGRLANVYGPKAHYLTKDPECGMVSTGAAERTQPMYKVSRGMKDALIDLDITPERSPETARILGKLEDCRAKVKAEELVAGPAVSSSLKRA